MKYREYDNHHTVTYICPLCGKSITGCYNVECENCDKYEDVGYPEGRLACSRSTWFIKDSEGEVITDAILCQCHPQLVIGTLIASLIESNEDRDSIIEAYNKLKGDKKHAKNMGR